MDEPDGIIPDGTCIDCGRDLIDPTALLCPACQAEIAGEEDPTDGPHDEPDWNFCDDCGCYLTDAFAELCDYCQAASGQGR